MRHLRRLPPGWRLAALPFASLLFMAPSATGQSLTPLGPDFQINSYTTSCQWLPGVAATTGGDFVTAWNSCESAGGDTSSIQLQLFDADGPRLLADFQVNTYTTGYQNAADVAGLPDGSFVVAWASDGSPETDQDRDSIQLRRFAADGGPIGDQFQANSVESGVQRYPSIAVAPSGQFLVVWQSATSAGTDSSLLSIQARRFRSDGAPIGADFQVNTYTNSIQFLPDVAVDANGEFVIVWTSFGSFGSDASASSIQGQRLDSLGNPLGGEFQVNSTILDVQRYPHVASLVDGGFVVTWFSYRSAGSDTSDTSIQASRFAADGSPLGGDFQVNTYTTGYQNFAGIAATQDGGFLITWNSDGSFDSDTSGLSTQMQAFDASGQRVGLELQINSHTPGHQQAPKAAISPDDRIAVVWFSDSSTGTDTDQSIQARIFDLGLFADGFESGDLQAWSSSSE